MNFETNKMHALTRPDMSIYHKSKICILLHKKKTMRYLSTFTVGKY